MARRTAAVGVVALLIASLFAVLVLSRMSWDVTVFTAFGEESTEVNDYAEERIGQVFLRASQGHDGKFFFIQANDPWVLEPELNAAFLDRPLYRSQRMLYPVLAGGGGLFTPEMIVWALIVVNILAMGVGSWAVAGLATTLGGSQWWGLSFVLNLGLISEMNIDGAGVLAAAAAFAAILAFYRNRTSWGFSLLVVAVLAREAMLLVAAGVGIWMWMHRRNKHALMSFAIPVTAVGAWAIYLRTRIGWETEGSEIQEIGIPFVGFVRSISEWLGDPFDFLVAGAVLLILVVFARRAIASRELLGYAFVGFAALGIVFTKQVWQSYFDITRAIAPAVTAFVVLAFAHDHRKDAKSANEVAM
ncbi:hypothetical protein BH23ACT4_BH23ACT4_01210 [soil metagenome]